MTRKRRSPADEPWFLVRTLASDHESGGEIGRHRHDWHQLIYAASGVLRIWTERGSWIAPPSWALWVPAGIRHGIAFTSRSALRTLYLRPGPNDGGGSVPVRCGVVTVSALLRELILKAIRLGMLDMRVPAEAALATLIVEELHQSDAPPFALPQPASAATRRAAELIAAGGVAASNAALAKACGVGARTLERRFHAETGMSPGRWRRQRLLLDAVERLARGDSVKMVAGAAGYAAPSAFVAAFRATFGITPGRYFD